MVSKASCWLLPDGLVCLCLEELFAGVAFGKPQLMLKSHREGMSHLLGERVFHLDESVQHMY